jgi:hypothetical protein
MKMFMVEQAIKYAELGWSVIPLVPKGKVPPKGMAWKKFQIKKATPNEIRKWWEQYPDANIGIVSGKVSGIVVVDFDGADAIERFEAKVCKLPETIFQVTGRPEGGKHAFFKYPSHGKSLKTKPGYLEGVDLKAVGGYVVVSPSIHPSGKEYKWINIHPIENGLNDLLEMPQEMIDFFSKQNGNGTLSHNRLTFEPVKRGKRNSTLASLVGKWLSVGMDSDAVHLAALGWNSKLEEPLSLNEVRTVVESIQKTDKRNHPEKYDQPVIASPRLSSPSKPENSLAFPFKVMTGAAGYFANVFGSCVETPEHFLFMAYLTCLGAVVSPRLTLKSAIKTQPRLFTVLVGESATDRKSTTLKLTIEHFESVLKKDFNACWGIGSAEGLCKILKKRGLTDAETIGTLLTFDELKAFVSKCNIDSSVLLPIVNTLFESNLYESHTKKQDINIEDAYLSMLAATTIHTYERIYNSAFLDIGFPNRVFLVPGTAKRQHSVPIEIPHKEIIKMKENLQGVLKHVGQNMKLEMTPEAYKHYDDWYMNLESSIYAKRLDTYSLRFMLLLAINNFKPEIDLEIVEQAIALCNWQFEVREMYDPIDAETKSAKLEESIRRNLRKGPLKDYELKQKTGANRVGLWFYESAIKNLQKAKEIGRDKKLKKWIYLSSFE